MSVTQGIMRIGEVHALLRKDYPEIELSKIRYYEDKGLVQPGRSRKGYRLYSERDVQCLREAIRLAQEEFVPLRVVRLRLIEQGLLKDTPVATGPRHAAREAVANAVSIPVPTPPPVAAVPSTPHDDAPASRSDHKIVELSSRSGSIPEATSAMKVAEFLDVTGLDQAVFDQLSALGLFAPSSRGRDVLYTQRDVRIARSARVLVERGADVRLLGALRRVAQREVGVIDDLTAALRSPAANLDHDEARSVTRDVANEVASLRAELFERELGDYLSH